MSGCNGLDQAGAALPRASGGANRLAAEPPWRLKGITCAGAMGHAGLMSRCGEIGERTGAYCRYCWMRVVRRPARPC